MIHPALTADGNLGSMFVRARQAASAAPPALYYALMTSRLTLPECRDLTVRLRTPTVVSRAILDTAVLRGRLPELDELGLPPSAVCAILEEHYAPSVLACAIAEKSPSRVNLLLLYLTEWRRVRTALDGDDLLRMGVPSGRRLGQTLKALRDARLDGKIDSREDEIELVQRWLSGGE
jgi:tRNA nucleotidyltransferase (CCA-adding enzyme)